MLFTVRVCVCACVREVDSWECARVLLPVFVRTLYFQADGRENTWTHSLTFRHTCTYSTNKHESVVCSVTGPSTYLQALYSICVRDCQLLAVIHLRSYLFHNWLVIWKEWAAVICPISLSRVVLLKEEHHPLSLSACLFAVHREHTEHIL